MDGVDEGRHRRRGIAAVTHDVRVGVGVELVEEGVLDAFLDDDPCARHADLSAVVELTGSLLRRRIEIGVGEDEEGGLAAQLGGEGTMFSAAALPITRAVGTEPVKLMRLMRGSDVSALPSSAPRPCTMLNTPPGKPASSIRSASRDAESGDQSAGLRMTVLPAARAGAHFHVESMNGAFHGVMMRAGPAGMRITRLSVPRDDHTRSSWSVARSA